MDLPKKMGSLFGVTVKKEFKASEVGGFYDIGELNVRETATLVFKEYDDKPAFILVAEEGIVAAGHHTALFIGNDATSRVLEFDLNGNEKKQEKTLSDEKSVVFTNENTLDDFSIGIPSVCMNGVRVNAEKPMLLDFYVITKEEGGKIYGVHNGWWEDKDWHYQGSGWINMITQKPKLKDGSLHFREGLSITRGFSDEAMFERFIVMRKQQDRFRTQYMEQLSLLEKMLYMDLSAWKNLINERPEIDIVEEIKERNLGTRKIASIVLLNNDNKVVDALVLDERGNGACALDESKSRLECFAYEWCTDWKNFPSLEYYITWVATRNIYPIEGRAVYLGEPSVKTGKGYVKTLAISLLEV